MVPRGRGGGTGRRTWAVGEEEEEGLPEQGGAMGRPESANAGRAWHRIGPGRVGFSMLLTIDAASGIPGLCGRKSSVNLSETRKVGVKGSFAMALYPCALILTARAKKRCGWFFDVDISWLPPASVTHRPAARSLATRTNRGSNYMMGDFFISKKVFSHENPHETFLIGD